MLQVLEDAPMMCGPVIKIIYQQVHGVHSRVELVWNELFAV